MRYILIAIFIFFTSLLISDDKLQWHTDIELTFQNASKTNTDVIVMVGEDYCKWCQKMSESTLEDPRIKDILSKYALVYIKRSDKKSISYVPPFDGNIPSFFFMNKNKDIYESIVGYFTADDFLEYIKDIEELK